jgi:crossover junction endodeoxyribonuclease RuvC
MPERILGIDPGTHNMGYGIIDAMGPDYYHVASGALRPSRSEWLGGRLWRLLQDLLNLIDEYKPTALAVERPFVPRGQSDSQRSNVASALAIGQAEALVLIAAAARDLPLERYAPGEIKKAVSNDGRGSKLQVQEMVRLILRLAEPPQPLDATDALAVAICHLQSQHVRELVEASRK